MNRILLVTNLLFLLSFCVKAQDEIGDWQVKEGQIVVSNLNNSQMANDYWSTIYSILPTDLIDR